MQLRAALGPHGLGLGLTEQQLDQTMASISSGGRLTYPQLVAAVGLEEAPEAFEAASEAVKKETVARQVAFPSFAVLVARWTYHTKAKLWFVSAGGEAATARAGRKAGGPGKGGEGGERAEKGRRAA